VAAVRSGTTCRVVAERFGVAVSSVVKWSQLEARTGAVVPGRTGGRRKPILAPHHDWPMARVQSCSEVTLFMLRDELRAQGVQVSHDTVRRYLRGAGLSFKKSVLASEQDRPYVARTQAGEVPALSAAD
jgi:transposase